MTNEPYKVVVVVDASFGERLLQLPEGTPVWIVDTPLNRKAAEFAWQSRASKSHLDGITTFKVQSGVSAEENLVRELDNIDLHHGWYSAPSPYTVLEVIGTALTHSLRAELGNFGFNGFNETSYGFSATRPIPPEPNG